MLSKGWESEIHIVNIYKKRNAEREKKKQIDKKERRKEIERESDEDGKKELR